MTCPKTGIHNVTGQAPVLMKVWSWRQALLRAPIEPSTKLLLLALSTYMNDHGEGCYPSIERLCKDTSLSERTVFYHLKKAESEGFLVKDKRELSGRKWAANEYRAAFPVERDDNPHSENSPAENTEANGLSNTAIIAVNNPEVHLLHPILRDATDAPHDESRSAIVAVEGCNDCSRGVQPLHTNSSENSSINPKELSPSDKKSYPDDFVQFWLAWPESRRCEKPNAYTAWKAACRKIPADALMSALQCYVLSKEATEGFAPYPAKWLKRERWLEFMSEASPPQITTMLDKRDDDTPEAAEWFAILKHLRSKHGEAVCRSWFGQLRLMDKQDGQLVLQAPTRFVAEWVKTHYAADILEAVQRVWLGVNMVRIETHAVRNRQFPTENIASATPAWSDSGQQ